MAPSVVNIAPINCLMFSSHWDWHTCRVIGVYSLSLVGQWFTVVDFILKPSPVLALLCAPDTYVCYIWWCDFCYMFLVSIRNCQFCNLFISVFARWKLTLIPPHEMHEIEYSTLLRGLYGIPSWFTSMYFVFFLELWNSFINYFTVAKEVIIDESALLYSLEFNDVGVG